MESSLPQLLHTCLLPLLLISAVIGCRDRLSGLFMGEGPVPCEVMFSVGLPHFSCRAQARLRQMVIAADRASEDWGAWTHREEVQLRKC